MKTLNFLLVFLAIFLTFMLNSCSLIGMIFKGMSMVIFIAVTVVIIIFIVYRWLRTGKGRIEKIIPPSV